MLVFGAVQEMNILYCFDSNFWQMAAVSISTLLSTQSNSADLVIYCMVAPGTRGRGRIADIIKSHGAKLVWRTVRARENPFRRHDYSRWSPVIFYRIFACNIFPDVDKMLYLDSDTVIHDDLSAMYATDLGEYALGGVRDMARVDKSDSTAGNYVRGFKEKYLRHGLYINSGVLLLNMPRMRECMPQLLATDVPLKYPDQDILNAGLDGMILELPLRYNIIPETEIAPKFTQEMRAGALDNPAVHHFYAIKPYIHHPGYPQTYSEFFRACTPLGFYPEDFARTDARRARHRLRSSWSHIPGVRITRRGNIRLFGIFRL